MFLCESLMVIFLSQRKAFLTSAVAMGAMFFLCSLVLFLGVKEQKCESPPEWPGSGLWVDHVKVRMSFPTLAELGGEAAERPSYLTALKMLLSHIPYQRLVLSFVFFVLAFQVIYLHKVTFFHQKIY